MQCTEDLGEALQIGIVRRRRGRSGGVWLLHRRWNVRGPRWCRRAWPLRGLRLGRGLEKREELGRDRPGAQTQHRQSNGYDAAKGRWGAHGGKWSAQKRDVVEPLN